MFSELESICFVFCLWFGDRGALLQYLDGFRCIVLMLASYDGIFEDFDRCGCFLSEFMFSVKSLVNSNLQHCKEICRDDLRFLGEMSP